MYICATVDAKFSIENKQTSSLAACLNKISISQM